MPSSILKKTPVSTILSSPLGRSREDRNRETAHCHAQLLQQRKDIEAQILTSLERLLDLPSSRAADAGRPAKADADIVKDSLALFQTSDYDSLIEERNVGRKCGYVLCPKPNRQERTSAKFRILQTGSKGRDALKVVERRSLERWCSDACGKRALYLKVQLNDEPGWIRTISTSGIIALLVDKSEKGDDLIERLRNLDVSQEEHDITTQMRALAIERGDGIASSRSFALANIRETSNVSSKPTPPNLNDHVVEVSATIEGYTPRLSGKVLIAKDSKDDDDDIMQSI